MQGAHCPYNGFAPQAPPVLQPPHAAAGPVADGTACAHGQVALQPLVGHGHLQAGTTISPHVVPSDGGPAVGMLTPSSSSMISLPMDASVVHLQLLVALTAQRLCALNLHTCGVWKSG